MFYREAEAYLEGVPRFVKKNTMQQTRDFYRYLGCPGRRSKVIHVAGTNGKGSVCCYMGAILRAGGYRVGSFTSPHLVTIRERMSIGQGTVPGEPIGEQEFTELFELVKQATDRYQQEKSSSYHPSYFEYLFFMAMFYFEQHQPDFILLETGLGGRLDATNAFPTPVLSILTRIGFDHTEYLGETIRQIAFEKAGIIKPGAAVVYLATEDAVVERVQEAVQKAQVSEYPVNPKYVNLEKVHKKGIDFSYHTGYYKTNVFSLSTEALYQMENAALCIQGIVALNQKGVTGISEKELREGLLQAHWEGRMEEMLPRVYLDGAHNSDGIQAFLETVRQIPCKGRRVLLFSVVSDKDYRTMADELVEADLFHKIVLAPLESSRRADMKQIAELFQVSEKELFGSVEEAFQKAVADKREEDLLYVAGSLYLIGQVKAMLSPSSHQV